jgi:uncharacterized phage-associated protein
MNHVAFLATLYKYPIREFSIRLLRFVSSPRWRLSATAGGAEGSSVMTNVFDVAVYILAQKGGMTAWKLQKLVYYSQAWSLVWDDRALFPERIEAWANGPVCVPLYEKHKGEFQISTLQKGDSTVLSKDQRETIDAVIKHYGNFSAQYLSELTHAERPWKEARKGLKPGERGNHRITLDSMAEYYGWL